MEFRRATIKDKERVMEICKTIWDGTDYIPNIYDKWMADEQGEFTLLLEDGAIMGTAKFTMLASGIGWMEGLRVAPEARSRGYAKEVTQYYINKGRQMGLNTLRLSTYYENYASIHVTESYGFHRIANFFLADKEINAALVKADEGVLQATIDSPDYAAIVEKLMNAEAQKQQQNLAGYGWLFKQMSEEEAHTAIASGHVYYVKEAEAVAGVILIYPDNLKDKVYYVVLVNGTDTVIKRLLQWAEWDAVKKEFSLIDAMVPEDQHLKQIYWDLGFKHWNDMRDPNVFIYELDLRKEE